MYNDDRSSFEKMLRRIQEQEPGLAGLLTRQVLLLLVPEARVLDVGEAGISCSFGVDPDARALIFPCQDDGGYLRYNVWLYRQSWARCGVEPWAKAEDIRVCLEIFPRYA